MTLMMSSRVGTGDRDPEVAIYRTPDEFCTLQLLVGGAQEAPDQLPDPAPGLLSVRNG